MSLANINVEEFVKDVEGIDQRRLTEKELSEKYKVSERRIRSWKQELRADGKITYQHPSFKKMQESQVTPITEVTQEDVERHGRANFSCEELTKLLSIHKTTKALSQFMSIPVQDITSACKKFNLVTLADKVAEMRVVLQFANNEYEEIEMPSDLQQKQEHLGVILSDWHAGKKTEGEGRETYNIDIFNDRAADIVNGILRLLKRNIKHRSNIKIVDLFLLGDLCDGAGQIYPGQVFNLETGFPTQVVLVLKKLRSLAIALNSMGFEVRMHCVPGNHGALDSNPENNCDTLVYMLLEDWIHVSKIKNVHIQYSKVDFLNVVINGYKFHLRHKGYSQNKTAAGRAKFLGWSRIHSDCDVVLSGHFHTPYFSPENKLISIMNGSLSGVDDFAEMLALASKPAQVCFGIPTKRPISFFYIVDTNR